MVNDEINQLLDQKHCKFNNNKLLDHKHLHHQTLRQNQFYYKGPELAHKYHIQDKVNETSQKLDSATTLLVLVVNGSPHSQRDDCCQTWVLINKINLIEFNRHDKELLYYLLDWIKTKKRKKKMPQPGFEPGIAANVQFPSFGGSVLQPELPRLLLHYRIMWLIKTKKYLIRYNLDYLMNLMSLGHKIPT